MLSITMIREMLIRTTMRSQLIPVRVTFIKNKQTNKNSNYSHSQIVDNLEPLCIADRNVKWYRKEYGGSSKRKQIELPYDPEIPLLEIQLKELKSKNRYLYSNVHIIIHNNQ